MIAYKLFKQRKDGTIGPLFFDATLRLEVGVTYPARTDLTKKGFATRPGWHCTPTPSAPHLSPKGRVWARVEVSGITEYKRPRNQGGKWYLASSLKVLDILTA